MTWLAYPLILLETFFTYQTPTEGTGVHFARLTANTTQSSYFQKKAPIDWSVDYRILLGLGTKKIKVKLNTPKYINIHIRSNN
jgi:hypothetical protein